MVSFTPQATIQNRRGLGQALMARGLNPQASASSLSPFAALAQGLAGGFLNSSANRLEQGNQAIRNQTLAQARDAALAGKDIGAILSGSQDPEQQKLGLGLVGQERARAEARKAREAQAKESARRFGITTDLERDKIRATTENAAATRGLREAQTKKALADAKKAEAESRFGPKLSVTEKKAIFDAQDELTNVDQTISTLTEALALNKKAFSGIAAETRGLVGDLAFGIGGEGARATREFGKVMSGEAIQAMANSLKGVTTDFELQKFEANLNDLSLPVEVRERTIQRMLALAQRKQQLLNDRISSVRNRTAFRPTDERPRQRQQAGNDTQSPVQTTPSGIQFRVK